MPSTLETSWVKSMSGEVEKLIESESKYHSILGAAEVSIVVQAFRFAL